MKSITVLITISLSVSLLAGCVVAPYPDGYVNSGTVYYHASPSNYYYNPYYYDSYPYGYGYPAVSIGYYGGYGHYGYYGHGHGGGWHGRGHH